MTVLATRNYQGEIKRGMWVEMSLYNKGLGVITNTYNLNADDCQSLGAIGGTGGGEVDIVFVNGGSSTRYPECLLRDAVQCGIVEGREPASEEKIAELIANNEAHVAAENAKEEAKQRAFAEAADAARNNPENAHLAQIGDAAEAKEVAKNLRKHLKKHYPSIKFSVRCQSLNTIAIHWEDGATEKEINELIGEFKCGRFDAYTDYHYTESSAFGSVFGSVQYLFTSRSFSDEAVKAVIDDVTKGDPLEGKIVVAEYQRGAYSNTYLQRHEGTLQDVAREISETLRSRSFVKKQEPKPPTGKSRKSETADLHPEHANPNNLPISDIQAGTHSKKKHKIFTVSLVQRVARETFSIMLEQAKELGGYYSSYTRNGAIAGFIFTDPQAAKTFVTTVHA